MKISLAASSLFFASSIGTTSAQQLGNSHMTKGLRGQQQQRALACPPFDADFGGCSTYASGQENHEFCDSDHDTCLDQTASQACCECQGNCESNNSAPDSAPDSTDSGPGPNGPTYAETQCFDQVITKFIKQNEIPGAGAAVLKNGEIVYAQGYGDKDSKNQKAFMNTPFRIASISKPVTSLTIMRLIQSTDLKLSDKVFGSGGILQSFSDNPKPGFSIVDHRLYDVTVEHLLTHTGGWDRDDDDFDPMFQSNTISSALGISGPATCEDTIYYMLGRNLDFTPGQGYGYSNFGYCILGRVIEKVTGQPYETAVRNLLLDPAGVDPEEMYLGSSLQQDIPDSEAEYFSPEEDLGDSVFPAVHGQVPWPYGAFSLEAMDAHGGWVASAPALMKIMSVVRKPNIFSPESLNKIVHKQDNKSSWYGLGFNANEANGGFNLWHDGALPGTSTIMVLTNEALGYAWAFLANRHDFDGSIDDLMWEAVSCVNNNGGGSWPAGFQVQ